MKISDNRQPEKQILGHVMPGLVFLWEPTTGADAEYYMVTNGSARGDAALCVNIETGEVEPFDDDMRVKVLDVKAVIV